MDVKRVRDILNQKQKCDVLYDERPVWIQDLKDNIATIGFIDKNEEKNVYIEDLYEADLYNK